MEANGNIVPADWPSNYSLLRLWHMTECIHKFVATLAKQTQHRHMFLSWKFDQVKFMSRVIFPYPPNYVAEAALAQNLRDRDFPDRPVRKTASRHDVETYRSRCELLCQGAAEQEQAQPVSFALSNSWADTLKADKAHFEEYTAKSQT